MSHTPGPWRLVIDMNHAPIVQRKLSGGFAVIDKDHERALADARLIAAAPDLLEALNALIDADTDWKYHDGGADSSCAICAGVAKAKAAIAKATK